MCQTRQIPETIDDEGIVPSSSVSQEAGGPSPVRGLKPPPLGVKPKWAWLEHRALELLEGLHRSISANGFEKPGNSPQSVWVDELLELMANGAEHPSDRKVREGSSELSTIPEPGKWEVIPDDDDMYFRVRWSVPKYAQWLYVGHDPNRERAQAHADKLNERGVSPAAFKEWNSL